MIDDLNDLPSDSLLEADVCVIGAGAAGLSLAREFFGTRTRVLVLESGGLEPEEETQALYQVENVGVAFPGALEGRARRFAGTTTMWGGQTIPLFEHDFHPRPWIPGSGWPLSLAELDPYYLRAEEVLQQEGHCYDESNWDLLGIEGPAFDPSQLGLVFSKFNRVILQGEGTGIHDFRFFYLEDFQRSENVRVLLHANATRIAANGDASTVEGVDIRSLAGVTARVRAGTYIVCCGGVETPRLLLLSNDVEPAGLGNRHDLVGRNFHEHPIFESGVIHTKDHQALQRMFVLHPKDQQVFWPRLELSREIQQRDELLQADANIFFDMKGDSGIAAAMELWKGWLGRRRPEDPWGNLGRAVKGLPEVVRFGVPYFLTGSWPMPEPETIRLQCRSEQLADPDSRITLSEQRDALGQPRARVDWRISELERRTVLTMTRTVGAEFERLDMGRVEISDWLLDGDDWRDPIEEGYHHSGTARMADDPTQGVVDRECRVHGIDNLYVASSAVFPTSGTSNTTLTIIALAIRIADRLKS